MSETSNLKLYKADPATDGNQTFNIDKMLNENWEKIDEAVGHIDVADASLTQKGVVQLSSAVDSDAEDLAATPKAVKEAFGAATGAQVTANAASQAAAAAQTKADQAFTSASEGKIKVRNAITGAKGTVADADGDGVPTFDELVAGVNSIPAGFTADTTALAGDILFGKTAYTNGSKVTGTMPNQGAVSGTITSQGGRYTIPAGYHNGLGSVTANYPAGHKFYSTGISGDNAQHDINFGFMPNIVRIANSYGSMYILGRRYDGVWVILGGGDYLQLPSYPQYFTGSGLQNFYLYTNGGTHIIQAWE